MRWFDPRQAPAAAAGIYAYAFPGGLRPQDVWNVAPDSSSSSSSSAAGGAAASSDLWLTIGYISNIATKIFFILVFQITPRMAR